MIILWVSGIVFVAFGFVVFFGAPYVPSRRDHLAHAFDDLYTLSKKDVLLDLGAGDGVVLRLAARRGARAIGYELNPLLVVIARWLSRREQNVTIQVANLWRKPFPEDTTVVYLFGDARDIARLTRRIEHEANRLARSLYVISYGFELPGYTPQASTAVHHLYKVKALQSKKPQV